MTNKSAFSDDEWTIVAEAPTSAGMLVLTAAHGGTFRETMALSKAYAHARTQHGMQLAPLNDNGRLSKMTRRENELMRSKKRASGGNSHCSSR